MAGPRAPGRGPGLSPDLDMTRLVLTNGLILAEPGATQDFTPKSILIRDGTIRDIAPAGAVPPDSEVVDVSGCIVAPGLVNGHHHSHEHYHKGRYDRVPLELWMNYVRPLTPIPLTPRQVYLRTLIGAVQALRSGTTSIVDDLNASPILEPELVEAAFQAYRDIGIRAFVGVTLFDKPFFRALPFIDEEFPPDLLAKLSGVRSTPAQEMLAFARKLAEDHHPSSARVSGILAPSAPQRCSDEFVTRVRRAADDLDVPVIMHVQETRLQAITGQLFYGTSMFRHLHDLGFLKPRTQLIHSVWVTPADIALIADSGASVQHNPNSNLKMGSGLAPLRALLDAGVNVSLGTDGCGSIETVDMLRTVASTALVHKLRGDDPSRWIGADEAWEAATRGGARALGFEGRLGKVAVGAKADLCCYRLSGAAFTPLNDPLRQLVYGETGSGLETIVVDGRLVMRSGRLLGVDETAVLEEARDAHRVLEPQIAAAEAKVEEMMPAYRRIFRRCQHMAIDGAILPARFPDVRPAPE